MAASLAGLGLHDLWLFAATVFVMNLTPGPDLVLTLTRTLQYGRRGGTAAALGIGAGCIVHTVAAAFGLAALLAGSADAFTALKWVGAAYLVWLAVGMLRAEVTPSADAGPRAGPEPSASALRPAEPASSRSGGRAVSPALGSPLAAPAPEAETKAVLWRIFRQGVLTNALNPKVAIFFLALLPQFIAADSPHKTLAFVALGGWFIVQGVIFLVACAAIVAPLRHWQGGERARRVLRAGGGVLFLALAARLALVKAR